MKKILLMVFAVMFTAFVSQATNVANEFRYMTFTLTDGSEVSYSLNGFVITYDSVNTYVESEGEKYTIPTATIVKMNFTENPTSISSPRVKATLSVGAGGVITVTGGQPGTLRVYSTDGAMVYSSTASAGETRIDLSGLPDGIYIVKVNGQSLKFEKK